MKHGEPLAPPSLNSSDSVDNGELCVLVLYRAINVIRRFA